MSFVDKFISEESFGRFELDEVDYTDIAFGIIIGNLDKIQDFSLNFFENLHNSKDTRSDIKVVLLGRVFQIIEQRAGMVREKDRPIEISLIKSFCSATDVLIPLIANSKGLADYIKPIYCSSFNAIHIFKGNKEILLVALNAYPLKSILNLQNNLFLYEPQDLEYIYQNSFENPEKNLELIKTGFLYVRESKLAKNELLSIVTYRIFFDYLGFLVNNKDFFSFEIVQGLLNQFGQNFTFNQISKIKDVLRNLEINYSVKFRLECESKSERFYENKERNKEEWGMDKYWGGYNEAEMDYYQNELSQEDYRGYDKGRSYNEVRKDSRNYERNYNQRFNSGYRNNFRSRNRNRDIDTNLPIVDELSIILNELRQNFAKPTSLEFMKERLTPYVLSNQNTVYHFFNNSSYNEKYYSEKSIFVWSMIVDSLEQIPEFNRDYLEEIRYNLQYIKDNGDYRYRRNKN